METKTYFFNVDKKFFKQGYVMVDDNKEVVYEAKMTRFTLFRPFTFEFVNHLTGKTAEHKVGHTVTASESGLIEMLSLKSSFKYDGKKIWDYLHELGIRIDSGLSKGSLGMTYDVTLKGQPLATIAMASPNGKNAIIVSHVSYNVTTTEDNLDLAFLVTFAFARTEQVFYD